MRVTDARQRILDKRWEYCEFNGDDSHPIGYCHAYKLITPSEYNCITQVIADHVNSVTSPFKHKYHDAGHSTPEEAKECYRQYLLDQRLTLNTSGNPECWHKCESAHGCWEHTNRLAVLGHHHWYLCNYHMNRENVEQLFPKGSVGRTYYF